MPEPPCASWTLATEYGFRDIDGRQPDFGGYYQVQLDPARTAETARIAAALDGG
jgi:hypothetical protein